MLLSLFKEGLRMQIIKWTVNNIFTFKWFANPRALSGVCLASWAIWCFLTFGDESWLALWLIGTVCAPFLYGILHASLCLILMPVFLIFGLYEES